MTFVRSSANSFIQNGFLLTPLELPVPGVDAFRLLDKFRHDRATYFRVTPSLLRTLLLSLIAHLLWASSSTIWAGFAKHPVPRASTETPGQHAAKDSGENKRAEDFSSALLDALERAAFRCVLVTG